MDISFKIDEKRSAQEIFEALRNEGKEAVLLEGHPWSFVGVINREVKVPDGDEGFEFMRQWIEENPCEWRENAPRSHTKNAPPPHQKNAPPSHQKNTPSFVGGFVGFVSYDLGLDWIGIKRGKDYGRISPDAHFVFVDEVYAVPFVDSIDAQDRATNLALKTSEADNINDKEKYLRVLAKIRDLLYAGETYQVNYSRYFEQSFNGAPYELAKKLIALNPSPMQFFMETDEWALISNSPERLFKIQNRKIETRPIKGTVQRGKTSKEDENNIARLLASEKEEAELSMIVDLSRNDMGKVAKAGSLNVREHRAIQKLSHVIHTYSVVEAELAQEFDWLDTLRAFFPGGSITGCPKKRTMEIIALLENRPRGVYCGSAGYIGLDGACDFNIMIRTLWLDKKSGIISFNSGGGIVVASDPQMEFEETEHKARAIKSVL